MSQSQSLFYRAKQSIVGGVNSPVRAFASVGAEPRFIESAKGAYLYDADGQRYIDYVGSWGPMIAGHAHPHIITAVERQLHKGLSYGAPTELEVELAERIISCVPSIEQVRMVNSGTEATSTAIRLARGFTRRNKILKFNGCYHGHCDPLLVKAGSGALTLGQPDSAGIPEAVTKDTLVVDYNDLAAVTEVFGQHGLEIAAVILEPIAGNMNMVMPVEGFLSGVQSLCQNHGALLIFDEVMTGFRVGLGGAQGHFGMTPDLTTLGKVIGGGAPAAVIGGRADIMSHLAPLGSVYQAGTLSGNPLAMAAGLATLDLVAEPNFYEQLEQNALRLLGGISTAAQESGIPVQTCALGGMFGLFFTEQTEIRNLSDVQGGDADQFVQFFQAMLAEGIYLAPSMYEAGFVSSAHTTDDIEATVRAARFAFEQVCSVVG